MGIEYSDMLQDQDMLVADVDLLIGAQLSSTSASSSSSSSSGSSSSSSSNNNNNNNNNNSSSETWLVRLIRFMVLGLVDPVSVIVAPSFGLPYLIFHTHLNTGTGTPHQRSLYSNALSSLCLTPPNPVRQLPSLTALSNLCNHLFVLSVSLRLTSVGRRVMDVRWV